MPVFLRHANSGFEPLPAHPSTGPAHDYTWGYAGGGPWNLARAVADVSPRPTGGLGPAERDDGASPADRRGSANPDVQVAALRLKAATDGWGVTLRYVLLQASGRVISAVSVVGVLGFRALWHALA